MDNIIQMKETNDSLWKRKKMLNAGSSLCEIVRKCVPSFLKKPNDPSRLLSEDDFSVFTSDSLYLLYVIISYLLRHFYLGLVGCASCDIENGSSFRGGRMFSLSNAACHERSPRFLLFMRCNCQELICMWNF